MKLFNNNTGYLVKRYVLMAVISLTWLACEDNRDIDYKDGGDVLVHADPYLQVLTGFVQFEVGTPTYDFEWNVINGVNAVTGVTLYGSFFDSGTGLTSNEVVYGEYPITEPQRTVVTESLTYDELKAGLLVDGNPLPATDDLVAPGSGWSFRFEADYASGETLPIAGAINMVLSKYAGNYEVIESSYYRIGVDNGNWNGQVVFIGFVDQTILSYNDFWGPFGWAGKSFHFSFDPDDLTVTAPLTDGDDIAIPDGLFSGNSTLTCAADASSFDNVPCVGSNKIVDDEGGPGKHRIYLTYGYFTDGSGPREFYEVLEKIVD